MSDLYVLNKEKDHFITEEDLEKSLYFGFIISYVQGLSQLKVASDEFNYNLNLESICKIWRGGCIIRADLLELLMKGLKDDSNIMNLLQSKSITKIISECEPSVRKVCKYAINLSIPFMGISSTLSYFNAFKTKNLPSNLIQAQRDYFGEHTYERIDKSGFFHTEWD